MGALAEKYQDERPYEVLGGQIYYMASPTTNHGTVQSNIYNIFEKFLKGKKCRAFNVPTDIFFDDENTLVPDVFIVCNRDIIKLDGIHGAPDLIVEVLSRSTEKKDRGSKKSVYEKYGVKEYWLVDVVKRSIEIYILKDGKYELDNVYGIYEKELWDCMSDEDKAKVAAEFKTSLYGDDLIIQLADVFEDLI
ncbi:hypothetical protein FACS1894188_04330 [Clostridia bacterium]|nr:hypothetical protein FACS1894188_04330 [Clostridia bacterium]